MSDVKLQAGKKELQEALRSTLLRKDVIVVVVIGLLFVGFHFGMSGSAGTSTSATQPGTQAWCVMHGQKGYRELMREFGFSLPQSQNLLKKCAELFEVSGGENAKIFKEQQDGMKNATTPVTTGTF